MLENKLFPNTEIENRQILQGDVLENLNKLPSGHYNCIITSPPYGGAIRDYAIDGQWGLEKDPFVYLDRLRNLMDKLWRVLRKDGIAWINIGDSIVKEGWFGFPERFFVNCLDAGWKSVTKPIWFKRNAMPLSTKKRFSPKYEPIYGFAKSDDYYFNLDEVRVPVLTEVKQSFNFRVREGKKDRLAKKYGKYQYTATNKEKDSHDNLGVKKQNSTLGGDGKPKGHYEGFNGRYDHEKVSANGKNPGDIFDITVKPFKGAHFATFPVEIPELFIRCSCPENGWVLDPFFGSGTVGLVAEQLNRNWTGIELKHTYIEIAKDRISKNTGVNFE